MQRQTSSSEMTSYGWGLADSPLYYAKGPAANAKIGTAEYQTPNIADKVLATAGNVVKETGNVVGAITTPVKDLFGAPAQAVGTTISDFGEKVGSSVSSLGSSFEGARSSVFGFVGKVLSREGSANSDSSK